jgi:hypothetical protein
MAKAGLGDTYSLDHMRSVPFPTRLLELTLTLPETQARIVLYVVRSTLGWKAGSRSERRASFYTTHRNLRECIGRSSTIALSQNLEVLVRLGIIEVLTAEGMALPANTRLNNWRRGLRLRIARLYVEEEPGEKGGDKILRSQSARALIAAKSYGDGVGERNKDINKDW